MNPLFAKWFTKGNANTLRLVIACVVGGLASLTILLDIPDAVSYIMKVAEGAVILLFAFRFYRVKSFFITLFVFLFSSLIFLGVITGIYFITKSGRIAIRGGNVYFDLNARELLAGAFLAYITACVIVRIYNKRLSKGEVYMLRIEKGERSKTLFALGDTGNRLREPFSNSSVIVADKEALSGMYDESSLRVIPASTVSSNGVLYAFKTDRVCVKCESGDEVIEGAYIALCDGIKEEDYSAVINPEILCV